MQPRRSDAASKAGLAQEVGRVDDERVTVPVAAGVAHPLPRALRQMRPSIERHDARAVHHLVQQDDVVRRLDQVDVLVVARGRHRGTGIEAEDAPDRKHARAEVVDESAVCRRVAIDPVAGLSLGRPLRFGLGRQRRHAPIRRIDDERRLIGLADLVAGVEPELVVIPNDVRRLLVVPHGELGKPIGLEGGRFLVGEKLLVGQLARTFERRQRAEVPDAVQIRRAPRRPGRRPGWGGGALGLARGRGGQQQGNDHRARRRKDSLSHVNLPL